MAFQWYPVPAFGGGLNVAADPHAIQDDQWTWSNAVLPEGNQATTAPAFQVLLQATDWLPAGDTAYGWAPDLMRPEPGGMLLFSYAGAGPRLKGYRATYNWPTRTPNAYALTVTGNVAVDRYGFVPRPMTSSAVSAQQLILTGIPTAAGDDGAWKYIGDDTLTGLTGIRARHACAAGGHAIIANIGDDPASGRTIKVSDGGPNPLGTWTPDISNSADFWQADTGGPVIGLTPLTGGFAIIMARGLQVAQTTRQIPPFTVDRMQSRGGRGEGALTLAGMVYQSQGGLCDASGNLMAEQFAPYLKTTAGPHVLADPATDSVLITNGLTPNVLGVNLKSGAAWRHLLPFTPSLPKVPLHGTITMVHPDIPASPGAPAAPLPVVHTVMESSGRVWAQLDPAVVEAGTGAPESGAFVDSKDFTFGDIAPAAMAYVDRIKVDWEGASLDVWVAVRNHLGSAASFGAVPSELQWRVDARPPVQFTKLGTLTDGLSELPVRLKAKFFRWRFAITPGAAAGFRIRGFAIRYQLASDRRSDQ